MAEMVSLHFLGLMESLQECNSAILARVMPMWTPVFNSYSGQLPGHLRLRLQTCVDWQPPHQMSDFSEAPGINTSNPMLKYLQKVQFKTAQIEMQSSAVTQFYTI